MSDFTDADLERESLNDAAPAVDACPACGDTLDLGWPVVVPSLDPVKEWVRCRNCGAWVEQL